MITSLFKFTKGLWIIRKAKITRNRLKIPSQLDFLIQELDYIKSNNEFLGATL